MDYVLRTPVDCTTTLYSNAVCCVSKRKVNIWLFINVFPPTTRARGNAITFRLCTYTFKTFSITVCSIVT